MKCPECGTWSLVLKTRLRKDSGIQRRRECGRGHRFSTVELPAVARATFGKGSRYVT